MPEMSISGGKTISEPLAKCNVFPKMVTHMIAVGESTGALDAMLGKIADFYEDEVDQAVDTPHLAARTHDDGSRYHHRVYRDCDVPPDLHDGTGHPVTTPHRRVYPLA